MSSVARLSPRDYQQVIRLVEEAAAADSAQPFDEQMIERLLRLVPADHAGYYEFTPGRSHPTPNTFYVEHAADWPEVDWASPEVDATIDSWPLLDARLSGSVLPLRLSDFLTPAQLRRNAWYDSVLRPRGVKFQMKSWLPAPGGTTRAVFLVRASDRRDFDERDRSVLTVLRPHLASIRDRWERRHRPLALTRREAEVLEFVAEGLTNVEIAQRLVLSRGTIRTHVEHVFSKTGTHTRTAAVAWLRQTQRPS